MHMAAGSDLVVPVQVATTDKVPAAASLLRGPFAHLGRR